MYDESYERIRVPYLILAKDRVSGVEYPTPVLEGVVGVRVCYAKPSPSFDATGDTNGHLVLVLSNRLGGGSAANNTVPFINNGSLLNGKTPQASSLIGWYMPMDVAPYNNMMTSLCKSPWRNYCAPMMIDKFDWALSLWGTDTAVSGTHVCEIILEFECLVRK